MVTITCVRIDFKLQVSDLACTSIEHKVPILSNLMAYSDSQHYLMTRIASK